eukprot:SAG31_NODE_6597_length_1957_cov_1.491927_2_plen_251_part_00
MDWLLGKTSGPRGFLGGWLCHSRTEGRRLLTVFRDKGWLSAEITGSTHKPSGLPTNASDSSDGEYDDNYDDDDGAFIDAQDALYRFTSEKPPKMPDSRSNTGADELVIEIVDCVARDGARKWSTDATTAEETVEATMVAPASTDATVLGQLSLSLAAFQTCPSGDRWFNLAVPPGAATAVLLEAKQRKLDKAAQAQQAWPSRLSDWNGDLTSKFGLMGGEVRVSWYAVICSCSLSTLRSFSSLLSWFLTP